MALYSYRAVTAAGKSRKGTISGGSEHDARQSLKAQQVYPVSLQAIQPFSFNPRAFLRFRREAGLTFAQLAAFTRQLATMVGAAIPYDASLGMIEQETSDLAFKRILSDVRARVMEGAYLADAFADHPNFFPSMIVNMVRSGEAAGTLVLVMTRLAEYYDGISRLRGKIVSALVYPMFMALFSLGVVVFMVTYIIPKITTLFNNFGAVLPLPTRILIALSAVLTQYWWLLIVVMIILGFAGQRFFGTARGQAFWHRLELSLPAWKVLRRKMILHRFSQTLSTMLKSGVELKTALEISAGVVENSLYRKAVERVIFEIQNKGIPLSVAMRREPVFPDDLCQMIAIGEETATLDRMIDHVALRLSQEVNGMMESTTALFEPVMILIMGGVVGFIVVSVLLPMLQLNQLVG